MREEAIIVAKTREIACIHYRAEENCDLGKKAEFRGHCQTCPSYSALKGGRPARLDKRRQKKDKIYKNEMSKMFN